MKMTDSSLLCSSSSYTPPLDSQPSLVSSCVSSMLDIIQRHAICVSSFFLALRLFLVFCSVIFPFLFFDESISVTPPYIPTVLQFVASPSQSSFFLATCLHTNNPLLQPYMYSSFLPAKNPVSVASGQYYILFLESEYRCGPVRNIA